VTEDLKRDKGRPWMAMVALVVIALSIWRYWSSIAAAPPANFDDSYMFVRYAKHILAGHGHAWNPGGEQTYGITSLAYVGLITLLRWVTSISDPDVVRLGSVLCAVIAVIVMIVTAARYSVSNALRRNYLLWAGLLVPSVLASELYDYHSLTGMDTMLGVLMHSLLILVTMRLADKGTARALWPVVLVGYLAFLTRPDSALYSAFLPAAAILLLTDANKRIRLLITFWIALGAVLVIDAGLKYLVFGIPVPLPTYAKMHGHYLEYAGLWMWNPVDYIFEFAGMVLPFICILIALVKKRSLALVAVLLIPALFTLSTYFNVVQIMGYRSRFNMPSLPFFVLAAAIALDRFIDSLRESPKFVGSELATRLTAILALLIFIPIGRSEFAPLYKAKLVEESPKSVPVLNPGALRPLEYWQAVNGVIAICLEVPKGSTLAMSEYGLIGAAVPELSIYDPLGLHDPQTAREGFSAQVMFERAPDLIWLPHPDYVGMRREILAAAEFQNEYDYYPAAFLFGIAIRKDGEHAQVINEAFAKSMKKHYPYADLAKNLLTR
jgi:hypothetical protein